MKYNLSRLMILLLAPITLEAFSNTSEYYISPSGDDRNPGTEESPFQSIAQAISILQAGDVCILREGNYHESISLQNFKGSKSDILTFQAYPGEKVVIDGTIPIISQWKQLNDHVFQSRLDEDIWQLFANGQMLISARWPNGSWTNNSIWSREDSWIKTGMESRYGTMVDHQLADFNFDLSGAIGILNIASFRTYERFIDHKKGEGQFTYPIDCWDRLETDWFDQKNIEHGIYYYLEGKLEFLDSPDEWFYDPSTMMVYLWTEDGKSPEHQSIRGKTFSYGINLENTAFVQIKGIDFFSATLLLKDCQNVSIEDCNFLYPSYSKRMLRKLDDTDISMVFASEQSMPAYNNITNCTFEYMDGPGFKVSGAHNTMENCYLHDIDFSCTYEGGWTIHAGGAPYFTFRRNTVHTSGASECFNAGSKSIIEYCDLSRSGFLQSDGSLVQVGHQAQDSSFTRYNWVHHTVKQGLRFDNSNFPNSPFGVNGTMHHNVAWKTDRIFFKGENHFIFNNLSFDNLQNDLIISSDTSIQGWNYKTITRNNISNKFSGSRTLPGKDYPVPGIEDHNWAGNFKKLDIRTQLRDPDNLDFRPKAESELIDAGALIKGKEMKFIGDAPDIGPYEFGDSLYWIPGYKAAKASKPVPPDGSTGVKTDADLMWLEAYKSSAHHVYFGSDRDAVLTSSKGTEVRNNSNIYSPGQLEPSLTYYWRVDVDTKDGTREGDVWSFTVSD